MWRRAGRVFLGGDPLSFTFANPEMRQQMARMCELLGVERARRPQQPAAIELRQARERLDLARRLVELYHGTGRMEQDHVFRSLAKDLLPAD